MPRLSGIVSIRICDAYTASTFSSTFFGNALIVPQVLRALSKRASGAIRRAKGGRSDTKTGEIFTSKLFRCGWMLSILSENSTESLCPKLTASAIGVPFVARKRAFFRTRCTLSPTRRQTSSHSSSVIPESRKPLPKPRATLIMHRNGCANCDGCISQ